MKFLAILIALTYAAPLSVVRVVIVRHSSHPQIDSDCGEPKAHHPSHHNDHAMSMKKAMGKLFHMLMLKSLLTSLIAAKHEKPTLRNEDDFDFGTKHQMSIE